MNVEKWLRLMRVWLIAAHAQLASPTILAQAAVSPLCANPAQVKAIREKFGEARRNAVEQLGKDLGLSEAAVVGALPADRALGVVGAEFRPIWESLRSWPDAVVLIRKGGQVFEVHGPIHAGEPSKVSQYFNLDPAGPGLSGHLRPDLVTAIYAVKLPGREQDERGVLFFDAVGEVLFAVYVPAEHATPGDDGIKAFEATRLLMQDMQPSCPKQP
jgi:putative heme utilization carrier protein HutX